MGDILIYFVTNVVCLFLVVGIILLMALRG